ncbi:MAG: hypothetical protein Q9222_006746 [Ikaeria aurantiellina]
MDPKTASQGMLHQCPGAPKSPHLSGTEFCAGPVPPYEPNPAYTQAPMQHHDSYSIQQHPQQQGYPNQPMVSPPIDHQAPKQEYYPGQQATPQHQVSNPMPQMPQQQPSGYQTAVPLQNLQEAAAPVDCPMCRMRALTKTEMHSGNTTK